MDMSSTFVLGHRRQMLVRKTFMLLIVSLSHIATTDAARRGSATVRLASTPSARGANASVRDGTAPSLQRVKRQDGQTKLDVPPRQVLTLPVPARNGSGDFLHKAAKDAYNRSDNLSVESAERLESAPMAARLSSSSPERDGVAVGEHRVEVVGLKAFRQREEPGVFGEMTTMFNRIPKMALAFIISLLTMFIYIACIPIILSIAKKGSRFCAVRT
eukprot:TRINITY_DN61617_c0_g1_i1.p1 TRINITY_DN61617_c0_g1~~TRINITY_DN61617_c0_g1_i1.p1  ORF type:complete len:216 (-),score=31.94 TRINITY_DN61617_c0_g1_i1:92-739(-)